MTYRDSATSTSSTNSPTGPNTTIPASTEVGDVITVAVVATGTGHLDGFLLDNGNGGTWEQIAPVLPATKIDVGSGTRAAVFRRVAVAGDAGSTLAVSSISGNNGRWAVLVRVDAIIDTSANVVVNYGSAASSSTAFPGEDATPNTGSAGGTALYFALGGTSSGSQPVLTAAGGTTLRAQVVGTSGSFGNALAGALDATYPDDTPLAEIPSVANADVSVPGRGWVTVLYDELPVPKPVANAGPDQEVLSNATVQLAGSAGDGGGAGAPYTYQWTQTSGTTVALSDDTAANPTFTAPSVADTLVFQLVVTDSDLVASDPDTVSIVCLGPEDVAVPVSDITVDGWVPTGGTTAWGVLGDGTDGSYVESPDTPTDHPLRVGLSAFPDSDSTDLVTLRARVSRVDAASASVTLQLIEGASTVIATSGPHAVSDGSVQEVTIELTGTEIDSITDFNNLRAHLTASAA